MRPIKYRRGEPRHQRPWRSKSLGAMSYGDRRDAPHSTENPKAGRISGGRQTSCDPIHVARSSRLGAEKFRQKNNGTEKYKEMKMVERKVAGDLIFFSTIFLSTPFRVFRIFRGWLPAHPARKLTRPACHP